jgi:hypothetical protein
VDGVKSLRQILDDARVTEAAIRKNLEEALDYGVVRLTPRCAVGGEAGNACGE